MLTGRNNNKITNIQQPNRFKMATKIQQQKRFKRATTIKKQKKLKRKTTRKKELKKATNVTQQLKNNTSCNSSNSSSSSNDVSNRQKKALRDKRLKMSSSVSTEESSSTRSRERWKRQKDTEGYDDDPPSMLKSSWELRPRIDKEANYDLFNDMMARYGVALPFYLPENVTDRFIDLREMGLRAKCMCPRIYIPVCSENNRTYVNECILNCVRAKRKRRNGPCINYRRHNKPIYVVVPQEWNRRHESKIKPQKRRSWMRRIFDKIKEKVKKFWNAAMKPKINSTLDNGLDYKLKEVRNYLIDHLTAMNYRNKIEEFSNNFIKIANKTMDMKQFAGLFLRAMFYATDDDYFYRFENVIKAKENYEYYIKDMLIEGLGHNFIERVNRLFKKKEWGEFNNDYPQRNNTNLRNSWQIEPIYKEIP